MSTTLIKSPVFDRKDIFRHIWKYCSEDAEVFARYKKVKNYIRAFRKPSFYEVSTRCNLFCEGCYYFESPEISATEDPNFEVKKWEAFYRYERERKVSMAYFIGAEPALHQDRIVAAREYFPYGNIGSNGTIKITEEVPFRIGVSAWAATDEADKRLRGASVFRKAFKNYEGDPRAIILFTVSSWNIDDIPLISKMAYEHGIDITFNLFSASETFLDKIESGIENDKKFFRESSDTDSPLMDTNDLRRVHDTLSEMRETYPDTVLITPTVNKILTQSNPIYEIDENGIAIGCHSKLHGDFRYYKSNLETLDVKCITYSLKCNECRTYSGVWSTRLEPQFHDIVTKQAFETWLSDMEMMNRIFLMKNPYYEAKAHDNIQPQILDQTVEKSTAA